MGREIERKFLVVGESWRAIVQRSEEYLQGYLANNHRCSIRVRVGGDRAWLNIKSATLGAERAEYEYAIPAEDGREMLCTLACDGLIEKTRHFVPYAGQLWEVDEFAGANAPLVVAEIELTSIDEPFERPPWAGTEVTDDGRYYNVCLARIPYSRWGK